MTMMEDWECSTCHDSNHIHMCNSNEALEKAYGVADCPYCGAKKVNIKHLCKKKIEKLTHMCANCGSVSEDPARLCNPVKIDEAQKAKWKEIPERADGTPRCKNCDQPVSKPGHICDPILPYKCKYCGEEVTKTHHMCKGIIGKANYMCKLCGRLAVEKEDVCAGWPLK